MPETVGGSDEPRESLTSLHEEDFADIEQQRASLLVAAEQAPGVGALTGTHAAVTAPPQQIPTLRMPVPVELGPRAGLVHAPAAPREEGHDRIDELVDLLEARVATLTRGKDPAALARARLELGLAWLWRGEPKKATGLVQAALEIDGALAAAHTLLRRLFWARPPQASLVAHVEAEIDAAGDDATRADLLCERARLLEATGADAKKRKQAWERALGVAPKHPAALKGLESALGDDAQARADHLEAMAAGFQAPKLQAWLLVERAAMLDRAGQREPALHALMRAVALDPGLGPVRAAGLTHAAKYGDAAELARLLADEAAIETNKLRSARLELEAATILARRLGDAQRATALLERAFARMPTTETTDRRVLDDLVRLHEAAGKWSDALRVRRARLRFVSEPRAEAYELRAVAACSEKTHDPEGAILALERALVLEPEDVGTLETLDRLLAAHDKKQERAVLWVREAARAEEPARRVQAFLRAAEVNAALGRGGDALRNLRAAFLVAPDRADVLDALVDELTRAPSELATAEVKARIATYQQAAERAVDPARRVHYLEKVALLWDEVAAEPELAARAYEEVLAAEPGRRSALVGLASAAARAGDAERLARALRDEAEVTAEPAAKVVLLRRAARALVDVDPEAALRLLGEVEKVGDADDEVRAIAQRIHESAGRWDRVARVLRERADRATDDRAKLAHLLALARTCARRCADPKGALEALWSARKIDPSHPAPVEEILEVLEASRDASALAGALEKLADTAVEDADRVRWLVRAAEVAEHGLSDDARAEALYGRALVSAPGEETILDRMARIGARTGSPDERVGALTRAIDRAARGELEKACELAEEAVSEAPSSLPALRTLESVARATGNVPLLANALSRQADVLNEPSAKVGALWALAALVEWSLPSNDGREVYERILALRPTDHSALEAVVRRTTGASDAPSRTAASAALRGLLASATDKGTRLLGNLELAWQLEGDDASAREALQAMCAALEVDPDSVAAATGAARLAARLHDRPAGVLAALSLARLSTEPKAKAEYLAEAAELLLASGDRDRAADRLEQAIDADPDAVTAATRLAQLRTEDGRLDKLMAVLRKALARAQTAEAVVPMGTEVARIARDKMADLPMAIDALAKVRKLAPAHIPSLLTLAELYIAQRAWPEALDVLGAVVENAMEPGPKTTALLAQATVYERVLAKASEAERALRVAAELDPENDAVLRRLVGLVRARSAHASAPTDLAALLAKLVRAEPRPDARVPVWLELASLREKAGDKEGAERALVEAAAIAPRADLITRLSSLHGGDQAAFARSLSALLARGRELGRVDAPWLTALGKLEIESLGRAKEGIAHLKSALEIDASLHEARFVLAKALARVRAHDEVIKHVLALVAAEGFPPLMLFPDAPLGLELLEMAFAAEKRHEQALVSRELRAVAGSVDDVSRAALAARRLRYDPATIEPLDRATLVTRVLPADGRHVLLEVAAASAGVEAKALRTAIGELGISPRDRVGPRVQHPLRTVFDRVARMLSLEGLELVVAESAHEARLVIQDTPWVVLPAALATQPEPMQHAVVARLLARAALGVPWIDALPPPHALAYLVALARQVRPRFEAAGEREVTSLMAEYEGRVGRAIGRRQKKQLAELSAALEAAGSPTLRDMTSLARAVERAEARVAFLVTGDLLTGVELLATEDASFAKDARALEKRALAAVLSHPVAGDLVRFALSSDATALRWRLGSVWGA